MVTTRETYLLEREIHIAARPETVFAFLTDGERMRQWMGVSVTIDARPGGVYRVNVSGRHIAAGEFLEVIPNQRVVHTFGWEGGDSTPPAGSSVVEYTLTPDGDGTLLKLVHRSLPNEDEVTGHGQGWDHYMERLAIVSEGSDPGPDSWASPPSAK